MGIIQQIPVFAESTWDTCSLDRLKSTIELCSNCNFATDPQVLHTPTKLIFLSLLVDTDNKGSARATVPEWCRVGRQFDDFPTKFGGLAGGHILITMRICRKGLKILCKCKSELQLYVQLYVGLSSFICFFFTGALPSSPARW